MDQSLAGALRRLDDAGELLRVPGPVSVDFDMAAVLWELSHGPAVVFEDVIGHSMPVVGNLLNRRDKLAVALGVPLAELQGRLATALADPLPPEPVPAGAWTEQVLPGDVDLGRLLPIPFINEHDGGRYITAGLLFCRDPTSGRHNVSICRMHLRDGGGLSLFLAPTQSRAFLERHRAVGTRMEVAVALGVHPAMTVASQFLTPHDERGIAGGLLGEPLRVARCRTVDVSVPAEADIVLEGLIDPEVRAVEGPFGEISGAYAGGGQGPLLQITGVGTRSTPMFPMIVGGGHPEHLVTGALAREAGLLESIRRVAPGVRGVRLTEGGMCRFHAVIAIEKQFDGEGKTAGMAALAAQDLLKVVTVVDADIDLDDHSAVEWAVATRMAAREDVVLLPGMKSNPIDPTAVGGTVTKVLVDATVPLSRSRTPRSAVGVPAAAAEKARQIVADARRPAG